MTHKPILRGFLEDNLRYYKAMAKAFPKENVWKRGGQNGRICASILKLMRSGGRRQPTNEGRSL